MTENPVLAAVRNDRGFATKLGEALGISREAVWMWKVVPPKHAFRVARYMRMPIAKVCPEIFPAPKKRRVSKKAS